GGLAAGAIGGDDGEGSGGKAGSAVAARRAGVLGATGRGASIAASVDAGASNPDAGKGAGVGAVDGIGELGLGRGGSCAWAGA
ncbi:MAG: hypothetical protein KGM43_04475, partial [Planctomycetota bacterium]|nr:hypothetical protein [Planctomycetota bacterium]